MTNTKNEALVKDVAAVVIPEAVLIKCLDRPLGDVLLSRIFSVPSGWETKELQAVKGMRTAATKEELEAALASQARDILLLKTAGLSLEALKTRLQTQGDPKTVFLEQ